MTFDESEVVDRKLEQELFEEMLKFSDDARLLTVSDRGGRGKSTLLRRLRYNCDWPHGPDPRIASSLVLLQELKEPDFFKLINQIRKDLKAKDLHFRECEQIFDAQVTKDFTPFVYSRLVGTVDATGAEIRGGVQAGIATVTKIERADRVIMGTPTVSWSPEVEEMARNRCIDAFLDELKQVSDQQPVVLLLDAWDRCNKELINQITDRLIRPLCFNSRTKFIMVVAGSEQFRFKEMLGEQAFRQLVRSIESLSAWEMGHVKDFLEVNKKYDLEEEDIAVVFRKIARGMSLQDALNLADILRGTNAKSPQETNAKSPQEMSVARG